MNDNIKTTLKTVGLFLCIIVIVGSIAILTSTDKKINDKVKMFLAEWKENPNLTWKEVDWCIQRSAGMRKFPCVANPEEMCAKGGECEILTRVKIREDCYINTRDKVVCQVPDY